jgi:hypothetical protein
MKIYLTNRDESHSVASISLNNRRSICAGGRTSNDRLVERLSPNRNILCHPRSDISGIDVEGGREGRGLKVCSLVKLVSAWTTEPAGARDYWQRVLGRRREGHIQNLRSGTCLAPIFRQSPVEKHRFEAYVGWALERRNLLRESIESMPSRI